MDKKYLFFLDIDGTLLDAKYESHDPLLRQLIKSLQDTGYVTFAMNSNRSMDDILPIAEQFGVTGPLIAENGLYAYTPEKNLTEHIASEDHLRELGEIKQISMQLLERIVQIYQSPLLFMKDVVGNEDSVEEGRVVVSPVESRKYTVSVHFRIKKGGVLVPFYEAVHTAAEIITQELSKRGLADLVRVRESVSQPNVIVYSNKYTKHDGVKFIHANHPGYEIVAIGNDADDYEMVKDEGEFWAVKNAKPEALQLASKISKGEYTLGVTELLKEKFSYGQ